jgi:hypothetical protein
MRALPGAAAGERRPERRLFDVDAFQQRRGNAGDERDRGHMVGRIQTPGDALRQQEQRHTHQAARQMRRFDDAERHELADPFEPSSAAGVAPEKSSTRPATNISSESARGVSSSARRPINAAARRVGAALIRLIKNQPHRRNGEGQHVIDARYSSSGPTSSAGVT